MEFFDYSTTYDFAKRLGMTDDPAVRVNHGLNDAGERRMFLWFDIGEIDATGMPVLTYCQLDCQSGLGIEEAFNRLPREKVTGLDIPRELQEQCLRIAVSVCFLATGAD